MINEVTSAIVLHEPKQMERKRMKSRKGITIAGLLVLGLAFDTQFVQAQAAGSLDTTFGTGGTVTTTFSGQTVVPIGAVQQSNGDIVVVSQFDFQSDEGTGVGVTRYTAAGKLDTTFGTKGSTFTTFPNIIFQALWFAIQPNGAIVVGGGTAPNNSPLPGANQGFGLVRFTANGVLDTTFGTNGLVDAPVGPRSADPGSFLLQPNGQIVMAGMEDGNGERATNPGNIPEMVALARYNSNGSLDSTFGSGGVALLNNASAFQGINQIALLSSGDYLIVSEFGAPVTAQLSSTGVLQSLVTGGTIVNTTPTAFGELDSATLFQPNGDFIITQAKGNPNRALSIMGQRFSETAVLDTTFSSMLFTFGGERRSAPSGIALQSNGQMLVGGGVSGASPIFGGLARLNTNGTLDTTFGNGGTVTTDNAVNGVLVQADGKIVAVEAVGTDGIALARYLAN
jgi:uncharacterized delta-60 repeat protein